MNDYVKNLKNIEDSLSGNYVTSANLNVESIAEPLLPKETVGTELYSKMDDYSHTTDISVSYMTPKKVTVKRYILKK